MPHREFEGGMQQLAVRLPDDVMEKVRVYAMKRNISMSKAIRIIVARSFGMEADR